MLILFNLVYGLKDLLLGNERDSISIYFQFFVILPVYLVLTVLVFRFSGFLDTRYFYWLANFLCLFTIGSQLYMLNLNGTNGMGINSVFLIAVFGSFIFSGILLKHMLLIVPVFVISLILSLFTWFDFDTISIINTCLIYLITITGLLVTKYHLEQQSRLNFNKTESLLVDERMLKESYLRINSLSVMRKDLIAILAHDVRSPLASLQGVLQLAKDGSLSQEETLYYIDKVENQVSTVNFLINDILVWIKSQTEGADFEKGAFNISSLVEDLKYLFAADFEEKEIRFQVNLFEDNAFGQPDMIKTVLRNLISNAIKFSAAGDTITLESKSVEGKVSIAIIDEGVGMSEKVMKKLRTTFSSQLGTRNEKGIGIGLKICRALILAHKSKMEISSVQNEGTVISFLLDPADVTTTNQ
ncbi:Signal transduction histidine kinase [Reichenbachiella agariperforans]|uniref:histidine kinase n=2 Tax=Reichenbachiella agariperforans TaxID=156994 RepID=A0A1M6P2I2_REIAG|nr:Signal transduction histidine kinase [Reichenbachiella agariperforans]